MNGATVLAYVLVILFVMEILEDLLQISGRESKHSPTRCAIDAILCTLLIVAIWLYLL